MESPNLRAPDPGARTEHAKPTEKYENASLGGATVVELNGAIVVWMAIRGMPA